MVVAMGGDLLLHTHTRNTLWRAGNVSTTRWVSRLPNGAPGGLGSKCDNDLGRANIALRGICNGLSQRLECEFV